MRRRAARRSLPPAEPLPFLAAPVTEKVELARTEERRIRKAIAETHLPLADVSSEVERLMTALEQLARHADVVYGYLSEQDESAVRARLERLQAATSEDSSVANANAQAVAALEEQLAARAQLERQLSRFDAQMEHLAATLGAIHAQIVRMSVEEEAGEQRRVAEQVRDLRQEVGRRGRRIAGGIRRRRAPVKGPKITGLVLLLLFALALAAGGIAEVVAGFATARPCRNVQCVADGALLHP